MKLSKPVYGCRFPLNFIRMTSIINFFFRFVKPALYVVEGEDAICKKCNGVSKSKKPCSNRLMFLVDLFNNTPHYVIDAKKTSPL